jgi:hypothetical protein
MAGKLQTCPSTPGKKPNVMKTDYTTSHNKKIVQKIIYKRFKKKGIKNLIGLAGPNISNYLSFVKSMGIKMANIYEKNPTQLLLQILDYKFLMRTSVKFEDIFQANPHLKDTVYDLDFDCSILHVKRHIKRFVNNAIITLAIRPVGLELTLKMFSKLVSKHKATILYNVKTTDNYKLHEIQFPEKTYLCYQYKDKSNMLSLTIK